MLYPRIAKRTAALAAELDTLRSGHAAEREELLRTLDDRLDALRRQFADDLEAAHERARREAEQLRETMQAEVGSLRAAFETERERAGRLEEALDAARGEIERLTGDGERARSAIDELKAEVERQAELRTAVAVLRLRADQQAEDARTAATALIERIEAVRRLVKPAGGGQPGGSEPDQTD